MSKGDVVGTPVDDGPWERGTWVWHVRTKKGPWIVVAEGKDVVYVDTKPNRPAANINLWNQAEVTIDHPDVAHHYRSMLTNKEPAPTPSWVSRVSWEKLGKGIGMGLGIIIIGLVGLFILWLELGAPM